MSHVFRALLSGAYSLVWTAARPLLRRHKRLREGFAERLVPEDWSGPANGAGKPRTDVWLQAASGGEAYLVWELLEHLAEAWEAKDRDETGTLRVLTTTWTRQGLDVLLKMAAKLEETHPWLSVRATFFPLDAPGLMAKALEQARPRVVGLLETELWPGLMLACRKQGVPYLILNGRMTEKSLRNYLRLEATGFWNDMPPEHVCAISKADAARFARLFGAERVETVPNIKFDRAAAAAGNTVSTELRALLPSGNHAQTVLLASVREEEEQALLGVVRALQPEATVIIAPRHMHRVKAWQTLLDTGNRPCLLRSRQEGAFPDGSLVIWDTFGELGQLYQLADAVFVGGSLAPLGGQNILEPLALGKIPCTGPSLENFAWALDASAEGAHDSLEALGLLRRGQDAEAVTALLREQLRTLNDSEDASQAVRLRFQNWLAPRLGGSARCARRLLKLLDGGI